MSTRQLIRNEKDEDEMVNDEMVNYELR